MTLAASIRPAPFTSCFAAGGVAGLRYGRHPGLDAAGAANHERRRVDARRGGRLSICAAGTEKAHSVPARPRAAGAARVGGHGLPANVTRRLHGNFAPVHGTPSAPNPLAAYGTSPSAQALASLPPTPAQALADARQDTLDAVRGFFLAKNFAGQLPFVLALPGLRLMTGASNTDYSPSPYVQTQSSSPGADQVAAGLALMAGGVA